MSLPRGATEPTNRNRRIGIVHAALAFLALGVIGKAAYVQLVQGRVWSATARRQHFTAAEVPAPRGRILDAAGLTLATTRELVRFEIAPKEVRDLGKLRRALVAAKVDPPTAIRVTDVSRAWAVVPGRFVAEDVAPIIAMRGVYTTPVSDRAYTMSPGLSPLLGRVIGAHGADGLELTLDSLLRGSSGASQLARDARGSGRSFASPTVPGQAAEPGHSVTLTINRELQEIAERTLSSAVSRMSAEGGDIVILDPRTGEVLALAGERHGNVAGSVTAITEPFEPGSTLKPLIASALLMRGKARPEDVVPTRGGSYDLHGRVIHDEPHPGKTPAMLSLADVIRFSSNIGIVQFADRLDPREEYEALRDFGLGTPTGLPYSAEAAGTLRPPRMWSKQTSASLAMGYEVSVTPLQLAMAYAAIGNGGELLEPVIIKEIRAPDGSLTFKSERRVVRRVMSERVAATVRRLLYAVVEKGTAVEADLGTYQLAGKTGTPRRAVGGRYAPSQYNPNFVGLFPADAPQLVVVVRVTNPKGNFYGGSTAAPMTKTILQAALAARDAALDRSKLTDPPRAITRVANAIRSERPSAAITVADGDSTRRMVADTALTPVVLDLPPGPDKVKVVRGMRNVPNVRGLTLRSAVRSLHGAGFRVQLARIAGGGGSSLPANATEPASGSLAAAGSLVRLRYTH